MALLKGLSSVSWPDANIDSIQADFESVDIYLVDGVGEPRHIICRGYVSLHVDGLWDDMIVASATVEEIDPEEMEKVLSSERRRMTSGAPERNALAFSRLTIELIDQATVTCVASRFDVE